MNSEAPVVELIERGPGWWECPLRVHGLYGARYWREYRYRDATVIGAALTEARLRFVQDHAGILPTVDVGIGGGAFLRTARAAGYPAVGTDVNECAILWLNDHGLTWDGGDTSVMTFWDSIEHIDDPSWLLRKTKWAFISTPIYLDEADVRSSKHFKPGEHIHYWTEPGLLHYMAQQDFIPIASSLMECKIGRQGIGSFAFKRA